jgi:hypothetical protein
MTRVLLVAAFLVGTSTVASAGPYVGLGIGPSASIYGTDPIGIDEGGRTLRLLGGYRFGPVSGELAIGGQTLTFKDNIGGLFDTREYSLAAKYNHGLGYNFEVMAKAGIARMSLSHQQDSVYDTAGTGLLLGFGAEYRVAVGPIKAGAITLDYSHHIATLSGDVYEFEKASIGVWMLGFTIGF